MMSKKAFTKTVKFVASWSWVLVLRGSLIAYAVKMFESLRDFLTSRQKNPTKLSTEIAYTKMINFNAPGLNVHAQGGYTWAIMILKWGRGGGGIDSFF